MTNSSFPLEWEEDELENPIGRTAWVLNSLTGELTVLRTVETADGEYAPWGSLRYDIKSVVLGNDVASVCDRAFSHCLKMKTVQIRSQSLPLEMKHLLFATN